MMRECSVPGCHNKFRARGVCDNHYKQAARRHALPPREEYDLATAFWEKVQKTDTCWLWKGSVTRSGYGQFGVQRKMLPAHRVSYELTNGPIPTGLVIDHVCRNRTCVNPSHLRPVTYKQNSENRVYQQRNSTSGHRGVSWHQKRQRWHVSVGHNRVRYSGGYFTSLEAAAEAAVALRNRLFTNNLEDRKQ